MSICKKILSKMKKLDLKDFEIMYERTKKEINLERIKTSHVTILGCGGIGSFSAEFLARSGIINLRIVDDDSVELSNLSRQNYLFNEVGKLKVDCLTKRINSINPKTKVHGLNIKIDTKTIDGLIKDSDFVLSAVDSMETKLLINQSCVKNKISLIHASAIEQKGEIMIITRKTSCFNCIKHEFYIEEDINSKGIIPTVPTIIGLISSTIILNSLSDPEYLNSLLNKGNLFRFDFKNMNFNQIKVRKNSLCNICNKT